MRLLLWLFMGAGEDAKPGTCMGPSLHRNLWHTACKAKLNNCGRELTREEGCQWFLGFAIPSSLFLLGTSSGQRLIMATSAAVVMLDLSRSNLHWAVSMWLGGIPRGSCLGAGCCGAVALQPFGWRWSSTIRLWTGLTLDDYSWGKMVEFAGFCLSKSLK